MLLLLTEKKITFEGSFVWFKFGKMYAMPNFDRTFFKVWPTFRNTFLKLHHLINW